MKILKNITHNFCNNNKKAASMFKLTHIFFQSFSFKKYFEIWLGSHFLLFNTEGFSVPKIIFDITFLERFHFCSFLSFFLNFAWLDEKSTCFSSEISFGDFEQIWKHFPDYQMKTNFWRNQLQWTLTTTVYNEL